MVEKNNSWHTTAENKWNDKAKDWNKNSENMWENGSRKPILPFFMKHIKRDKKILDIGCGSGYSTNSLSELGYSVIGADISSKMISLAKENYPQLIFQKGDVSNLPYDSGQFSGILAINVLEWTEVPIIAINELHRVLQTGGKLCIGILGPTAGPRQFGYDRLYGEQVMMNTMQPWEFSQMAEENGFTVIDGLPIPKQWGKNNDIVLPVQAEQALSFMYVFILKK